MKKTYWIIGIIVVAGLAGLAMMQADRGGFGNTIPTDSEENQENIIIGEAIVDRIELSREESAPTQVKVTVFGSVADACTELGELQTQQSDKTFTMRLTTRRPKDAVCAQVLRPFEGEFSIDIVGQEPGVYTVTVNGVSETFEITN